MSRLEDKYNHHCEHRSDIHEHLPTLKLYASECQHITEMGVRWIVSTYAFLVGKPKKMISYDFQDPNTWGADINETKSIAEESGIDYQFHVQDVLKLEIEPTDLLFLDTWHVYDQLRQELELHSPKARKYIIMHDTTSFEFNGEGEGHKGLWPAVEEFLVKHPEWVIKERFTNNNGLTILQRNVL